jgi:hypothetical protein
VKHAITADNGQCSGGVGQTLGSFLYSTTTVAPLYKTFPYSAPAPFATKTVSGGGIYLQLTAGEGFTYTVTFRSGSKAAGASGAAPRTTAIVKVPAGFGTGTATVVLRAETNQSRTTAVTVALGTVKPKKHLRRG